MTGDLHALVTMITTWVLPVLLAVTLHEAGHAYAAWRLGDDTAYQQGRVTLNPLRHVDPFGTVLLPALLLLTGASFLIGWAKPVPVRVSRLRNPRRDDMIVSAAGPGANLLLAFLAALLLHLSTALPGDAGRWLTANLQNALFLNVLLMVFNLLPIPPLDGGHILMNLLPRRWSEAFAKLGAYGLMLPLLLLFGLSLISRATQGAIDPFGFLIYGPVEFIIRVLSLLTFHGDPLSV
jgi:Zn-dependent protease